jgi:hypothetical protein
LGRGHEAKSVLSAIVRSGRVTAVAMAHRVVAGSLRSYAR